MGHQAGGHPLPGGEGAVGQQCMDFNTLLGAHHIQRADGGSLGGHIGNVTGLAEAAVERILHDSHGVKLDDLSGLIQPLLDVTAAHELGDGIYKGHMACPTGRGGDDISTAFGNIVDDLGVIGDILIGGIVDIGHGHTQLGVDLHDQILDHGVDETGFIGLGGNVAVLVCPLILGKNMYLGAIHLEVVDQLRQGDVGIGLRIAQDHGEGLTCFRGSLQPGKQSGNQHGMGVHHHLDIKLRMPPGLPLLQFLAAELTDTLADLPVLKGHEIRGAEREFTGGFKNNITHSYCTFPSKITLSTFIQ